MLKRKKGRGNDIIKKNYKKMTFQIRGNVSADKAPVFQARRTDFCYRDSRLTPGSDTPLNLSNGAMGDGNSKTSRSARPLT